MDRQVSGLSPALFHLTNLILIAGAAAMLVVVVRDYTGNAPLASATGFLFALHPYHVENAAWIAARADPLCALLLFSAARTYDTWRSRTRGLPVTAMILFESALLAKESAASLPPVLILIGVLDRSRRAGRGEWLRGHVPLILVGALHFFGLRVWALGGPGRTLLQGFGIRWFKRALGFGAASIVPLETEILAAHPYLVGSVAVLATVVLGVLTRAGAGRVPRLALGAGAIFFVLLGPSLVGFQERYLFLPSAAAALAIVVMIRGMRTRPAVAVSLILAAGWVFAGSVHWKNWRQAASASERLVEDLERASGRSGVGEIVVANMPLHVRGGSVAGDFRAALSLRGAKPVPVRAATYLDYPTASSDALDGPADTAVIRPPPFAEVKVKRMEAPFSDYVGPYPPGPWPGGESSGRLEPFPGVLLLLDGRGGVTIRIHPDPTRGRVAYAWVAGKLDALF